MQNENVVCVVKKLLGLLRWQQQSIKPSIGFYAPARGHVSLKPALVGG